MCQYAQGGEWTLGMKLVNFLDELNLLFNLFIFYYLFINLNSFSEFSIDIKFDLSCIGY